MLARHNASFKTPTNKDAFIPDRHPPASSLHATFTVRSFGAAVQKIAGGKHGKKAEALAERGSLKPSVFKRTLHQLISHALFNLRIDSEQSKFDYSQTSYPLAAAFVLFCLRSFRFADLWEYYKLMCAFILKRLQRNNTPTKPPSGFKPDVYAHPGFCNPGREKKV